MLLLERSGVKVRPEEPSSKRPLRSESLCFSEQDFPKRRLPSEIAGVKAAPPKSLHISVPKAISLTKRLLPPKRWQSVSKPTSGPAGPVAWLPPTTWLQQRAARAQPGIAVRFARSGLAAAYRFLRVRAGPRKRVSAQLPRQRIVSCRSGRCRRRLAAPAPRFGGNPAARVGGPRSDSNECTCMHLLPIPAGST